MGERANREPPQIGPTRARAARSARILTAARKDLLQHGQQPIGREGDESQLAEPGPMPSLRVPDNQSGAHQSERTATHSITCFGICAAA